MTSRPRALTDLTTYLLSQTAKISKRALDDRLAERGLRLRHMAVLAALEDGGATSQLDLGRRLALDPSDVTNTVDDLVAAGYAARTIDPADRRRRLVATTAPGRRELVRLEKLATRVADDVLAPLPESRRRRLHEDLARVLAAHDARGPGDG